MAVEAARKYGVDIVIAVDLSGGGEAPRPQGTMATILQAVSLTYDRIASQQLNRADVVIRTETGSIGAADFSQRHEALLDGEKAAMSALPAINSIIRRLKSEGRL